MIDEFSSVVIDMSAMEKSPNLRISQNLWNKTVDQSKLKIGVLEINDEHKVFEELNNVLEFLITFSEFVRGKCIIFLLNRKSQNLKAFLEHAWSKDFLDFTIIEWVRMESKGSFESALSSDYEPLIHIFNPFRNKYSRDTMTGGTDILPEKLKDLESYPLHARAHEERGRAMIDDTHVGSNDWDKLHGQDVRLTKLLTESLHFTIVPTVVNLDSETWSIGRIARVLLGDSMRSQRRVSIREKVLLLTLYFVSMMILTLSSDELLKMILSKQEVLRFKTLEELADSDVSLFVTNKTRRQLVSLQLVKPILKKIVNRSIVCRSFHKFKKMIYNSSNDAAIYMGVTQLTPEYPFVSSPDSVWFKTTIDEVIFSGVTMMSLKKNSPFKNQLEASVQRMIESGLLYKNPNYFTLEIQVHPCIIIATVMNTMKMWLFL
ncbi:hypothetical protein QAD02_010613 [Eretmocerus hayati]|uniref:Uncharacterized protein n=1 Tax=Eretmocerus hayati TaxID=131215 RepID=A0ACC2NUK9_9HYME|nr:hypothetical protein QAD02_010613 [Eretmocerus hayati]